MFSGSGDFVPGSARFSEQMAEASKTGITLQNKASTTDKGLVAGQTSIMSGECELFSCRV